MAIRVRRVHHGGRLPTGAMRGAALVSASEAASRRRKASTTSAADAGRSAGLLRCNQAIRSESPGGIAELTVRAGGGSFSPTACNVAVVEEAANAVWPVAALYSTL